MSESEPTSPEPRTPSVVPFALFVPVLVVMAQSAWVVTEGWSFTYNATLSMVFHPIILGGMTFIAVLSFFAIRSFAKRTTTRWAAFLACVIGFTAIAEILLPKLAV
jgi:hypothetical protein